MKYIGMFPKHISLHDLSPNELGVLLNYCLYRLESAEVAAAHKDPSHVYAALFKFSTEASRAFFSLPGKERLIDIMSIGGGEVTPHNRADRVRKRQTTDEAARFRSMRNYVLFVYIGIMYLLIAFRCIPSAVVGLSILWSLILMYFPLLRGMSALMSLVRPLLVSQAMHWATRLSGGIWAASALAAAPLTGFPRSYGFFLYESYTLGWLMRFIVIDNLPPPFTAILHPTTLIWTITTLFQAPLLQEFSESVAENLIDRALSGMMRLPFLRRCILGLFGVACHIYRPSSSWALHLGRMAAADPGPVPARLESSRRKFIVTCVLNTLPQVCFYILVQRFLF
jgi:hypothetical protein